MSWPLRSEKENKQQSVTAEHRLAYMTLSICIKDKELFSLDLEKEIMLGKTIFKWFVSLQSQSVFLFASINLEKLVTFAKEMIIENVQSSHGSLRHWKDRNLIKFETLLEESSAAHQIRLMHGSGSLFKLLFPIMTWKTSILQMNLLFLPVFLF